MRRRFVISALVVFALGAVLGLIPFLTAKREATALTEAVPPLPPGSLVPATLKPGAKLCIRDLPMAHDGQVARILTATGGQPGAPIAVTANGPGYSATTNVPGGWKEGPLEIPMRPPAGSLRGTLCFRNAGTVPFSIMASGVGQKLARPQPYLDGQALQQDVPLWFHRAKQASLVSRAGALIDHAAVFEPLPPWFLWLLLAAVLVGIPLLTIRAVGLTADAPVADAEASAEPARSGEPARSERWAPAPPVPGAGLVRGIRESPRTARAVGLIGRIPGWAVLAAIALGAAIFVYVWASRVTTYTNDETLYVAIANWLPRHLPGGLAQLDFYQRGTQRLEIFVLAATLKAFGSPDGFLAARAVNALAFASTAFPAYLMARGLGVRKSFAVLAGFLCVVVPWTVLMTSILTEPLAYPAFAWAVWATWRAVAEPSPRHDLLALGLVFVALLGRSIFLALLALLPLSVVLFEARFGSWRPRDLITRHRVLAVAVGLGVIALVLSMIGVLPKIAKFTGQYGTSFALPIKALLNQDAFFGSRAAVGLGFVPFALGLAWIVSQAIRPRDPRAFAFAVVALLAALLLFYASKPIPNVPVYVDERYMIYLAPLLAVGCAAALDRGDLRVWAVVAAGLFAGWLLWHEHWSPAGDPTEYFASPAEAFYARVGLLRLQQYVPSWLSLRDAAFVLAALVTALCAYAVSRRPGARVARWALVAGLVVVQIGQAQYAIAKHVNGAGGRYWSTLEQRAWVDEYLKDKPGDAADFESGVGTSFVYDYVWKFIEFWNVRVTGEYGLDSGPGLTQTPGDIQGEIQIDPNTGTIHASPPLPAYMVLPRDFIAAQPAGTRVLRPDFNGQDLLKVAKPDRAAFRVGGTSFNDGIVAGGAPASVRFFAAGQPPGKVCAEIPIKAAVAAAPPSPPIPYRVGPRHGTMQPGEQVNVHIPLEFGGKPYLDVPVTAKGKVLTGDAGRTYAARLLAITTFPCQGG